MPTFVNLRQQDFLGIGLNMDTVTAIIFAVAFYWGGVKLVLYVMYALEAWTNSEKEKSHTFCNFTYKHDRFVAGFCTSVIIVNCNKPSGFVDIPEDIHGRSVSEIGDRAFAWCSSMTKVTIPSGVRKIGAFAFKGCSNLTEIMIPYGNIRIGEGAFDGCPKLTIYGQTGSKVQQYAFDHNIPFVDASKF